MRHRILFSILSTCLALLLASAHAGAVTLSYANFPPPDTFPCVQMEHWKKEVEKRTDGEVTINTFPGGTLLGAKNMLRGVTQGQADIGNLCMPYQPGAFPLTSVMELPLRFRSARTASLALWELVQKYQPQAFDQVKILTVFTCSPSNLMTRAPVKSPEDLKGMELRASGSASDILDRLGATPVSMPMSETPEALQKGMIQGLLSSLEVMLDLNFAQYCPYVTQANLQVYPFAVVMNKDKWQKLPSDVQEVMQNLSREQAEWTGAYADRHVDKALEYSRTEHDVSVFKFSDKERRRIQKKIRPLIGEWKDQAREKGLPAERILEDVRAWQEEYASQGK
ncbi:MAG: TRAP transporter substrate-binding protein [Desulfohalobiaceae bacterium]|nr:TRAP transporter substrate-binding protein [Desulfohalobiaceae bacterium]